MNWMQKKVFFNLARKKCMGPFKIYICSKKKICVIKVRHQQILLYFLVADATIQFKNHHCRLQFSIVKHFQSRFWSGKFWRKLSNDRCYTTFTSKKKKKWTVMMTKNETWTFFVLCESSKNTFSFVLWWIYWTY